MRTSPILCLLLPLLFACGKPAQEKPRGGPPPAQITVTQVIPGDFEVVEETLGTLEVLADPKVGAEVAGRVTKVLARTGTVVKGGQVMAVIDPGDVALQHRADEAEVRRLEALAAQQGRLLERQQALVAQGFLSKNAGDDITAQRAAVVAQLDAARPTAAAATWARRKCARRSTASSRSRSWRRATMSKSAIRCSSWWLPGN